VESVSNTQAVANVVAETNAALIAKYGPNPTQAQKDEFMELGKQALVDLAMTTEGGLSVTDMALGAQISGATTLLDLDTTAGAGATGIDASAQDVFDVITDQYSGNGFGTVDDTTIFTDDFTSSPNAQLQSTISETDYSGVGTTTGATTGAGTDLDLIDSGNVTFQPTLTAADLLANRAAQTQSGTLNPLTVTEETVQDLIGKINSGALTVEQVAQNYGVSVDAINAELAGRAGATATTPVDTTVTTPVDTTSTVADAIGATKTLIPGPGDTFIPYNSSPYVSVDNTFIPGGQFGSKPGDLDHQWGAAAQGLSEGDSSFLLGGPETATVGGGGGSNIPLFSFAEGGPTNPVEQRDAAVGSRLLRQAGIGSMQDKTMSPEMAGTLDRIMARRR
jgi:hypothetical protein